MLEREYQKKRKIRNRIYSKTTVVILVIVALILVRATWRVYRTSVESNAAYEQAALELQALDGREQRLAEDIARLSTQKGTEEEIRKKFSVAKEGETVVFVVDHEEKQTPQPEKKSMWGRIASWFGSLL